MDTEKIIKEYGVVMELTSGYTATSRRFLPYSKDQIKLAVFVTIQNEKDTKRKETLKAGYLHLAKFISDEDALVVKRFEEYMLKKARNELVKYSEDASLNLEYSRIQDKIAKEMKTLAKALH